MILLQIVQSLVHRHQLLVEVSELKAELQKLSSAVPQGRAGTRVVRSTILPGWGGAEEPATVKQHEEGSDYKYSIAADQISRKGICGNEVGGEKEPIIQVFRS